MGLIEVNGVVRTSPPTKGIGNVQKRYSENRRTAETDRIPVLRCHKATDQFRSFAEKSVEQSKEAYAKLKIGAEEAQKTFELTLRPPGGRQ